MVHNRGSRSTVLLVKHTFRESDNRTHLSSELYLHPSASHTSLITAPQLHIVSSLRMDALVSLLSLLKINDLYFYDDCHLQAVSKNKLSKVGNTWELERSKSPQIFLGCASKSSLKLEKILNFLFDT